MIQNIKGITGHGEDEIYAMLKHCSMDPIQTIEKLQFPARKANETTNTTVLDVTTGMIQGMHMLPDKLDPPIVAYFFRYTPGLDKNLIGDYVGNHDEFRVDVLQEFARMFDFQGMRLDTALRVFLETFKMPAKSQKIVRVLEAFAERYYEQSPHILADKDAALLLSYSLIMLNTDIHNPKVKKKMTEEDFIRNNRRINGGNDLPREYLSEIYHSICENEIRMTPEQRVGSH